MRVLCVLLMIKYNLGRAISHCKGDFVSDVICNANISLIMRERLFDLCYTENKTNISLTHECFTIGDKIDATAALIVLIIFIPFGLAIHIICPRTSHTLSTYESDTSENTSDILESGTLSINRRNTI